MSVQNTCDKCGKNFKFNYLMIRHQNKKNDCGDIKYIKKNISKTIDKISENINNLQLPSIDNLISLHFSNNKNTLIQCPHCCVKSFASKLSLARHIDKCDKVPENIKKKDKKTKSIEL